MDQTTLHKYFQGNTSEDEEKRILRWVEESEENKYKFKKERLLYDVSLFHDNPSDKKKIKSAGKTSVVKWSLRIAASILVIFCAGVLIKDYLEFRNIPYQTITVPAGQRVQIDLADGTKVWLNAQTTMKYSTAFGKRDRVVELDGEAYFEVTRNTGIPFYVITEKNKVEVVGTSFNINAYKGTGVFEALLLEGVVDIYRNESKQPVTRLNKNELYISDQQSQKVKKITSENHLTWKEGIYSFDDEPFKIILEKLEKYYNIKFKIENQDVLDYRITAKFREQDGVEHVLKTIQKDHKFTYIIDKESNIIIIK